MPLSINGVKLDSLQLQNAGTSSEYLNVGMSTSPGAVWDDGTTPGEGESREAQLAVQFYAPGALASFIDPTKRYDVTITEHEEEAP